MIASGVPRRCALLLLVSWTVLLTFITVSLSRQSSFGWGSRCDGCLCLPATSVLDDDPAARGQAATVQSPGEQIKHEALLLLLRRTRTMTTELQDIASLSSPRWPLPRRSPEAQRQLRDPIPAEVVGELQKQLDHLGAILAAAKSHLTTLSFDNNPWPRLGNHHEELRQQIEDEIADMGYFIRDKLESLQSAVGKVASDRVAIAIKPITRGIELRERVIMDGLMKLSLADGAETWRNKEHRELSDIMQSRIHYQQNPSNCSSAKKLVCNLNKNCGYGCQLHHAVYCLMVAHGTGRTMILLSTGWSYEPQGWETVFQPVSATCTPNPALTSAPQWRGEKLDVDEPVLRLPIVDVLTEKPSYSPQVIPEDLAARLHHLHRRPAVWFVGQFMRYLLRPQPYVAEALQAMRAAIGIRSPMVGVHVRRTDKIIKEAAAYPLAEYMVHVKKFFDQLPEHQSVTARRVYLASDDYSVMVEAKEKYPQYDFICDFGRAMHAGAVQSDRHSEALNGIITDIHFLSMSDYLVCTFSSQVCRVAYEIMNAMHPDASARVHSLDGGYYYGGQGFEEQVALFSHVSETRDEIDLKQGDVIKVHNKLMNGYNSGLNYRTKKHGIYPSYKARDKVATVRFPVYPYANITHHEWWFEAREPVL